MNRCKEPVQRAGAWMRSRRAEDDALVPAPLSVGWRDAPRTGVRWPSPPKERTPPAAAALHGAPDQAARARTRSGYWHQLGLPWIVVLCTGEFLSCPCEVCYE